MRATTSATGQRLLAVAFTTALTACASSPVYYEYQPTESPLRYDFTASVSNEVETPGGMQTSGGESEAIVAVSIGARTDSGTVFSVIFDSFRTATSSDAGSGELHTEDVEGATFVAALRATGAVDILEAPEIELEAVSTDDLAGIVISLLLPLPPGGTETEESWPHKVEAPVGSGLEGSSTYDGIARLAGDTTWNGIPAQKIVSEGTWVLTAVGTPPGSPTEIELQMEGTSVTTYFWDPARGVMLGAEAASSGSGTVMAMGFEMPISITASSTIALQMPGAATAAAGS
jgi:hypothetical protein